MSKSASREKYQAIKEEKAIRQFISQKGWKASLTGNGIYCVIDEEGTDEKPTAASKVRVAYKGYLLAGGGVFDESPLNGIDLSLSQVIAGWKEGIPLFGPGGKGKLIIPSRFAYGRHQKVRIPPDSVLVFEIHLINVVG